MATTTNFGWETPDDTDLVKDGAAAIRTALNGVDTSFAELKGGTTGQILAKTSGTDLDFTWTTPASGGKILQVVQTTKTNTFTTTSSTATAITGLDVTITPSSTSSKILVLCFMSVSSDSSQGFPVFYLQRGASQILIGDAGGASQRRVTTGVAPTNNNYLTNASVSYLDSPSSTSALTYQMYTSTADSSGTVAINRTIVDGNVNYNARGTSTIIAMEVKA